MQDMIRYVLSLLLKIKYSVNILLSFKGFCKIRQFILFKYMLFKVVLRLFPCLQLYVDVFFSSDLK